MPITPNLSYHAWFGGKTEPVVMIRGTEFKAEPDIEREDDEGHTGTDTLKMDSYRKQASTQPEYEDKARYSEGWEDYPKLFLGSATDPVPAVEGALKAKKYKYQANPGSEIQIPSWTLWNGYYKSSNDATKYINCFLDEYTVKFNADEPMSVNVKFASDAPLVNQPNPARILPAKKVMIQAGQTSIYYVPQGVILTEENKAQYKWDCFLEAEFSMKNNIKPSACYSEFGSITQEQGTREGEGKFKIPWNENTKWIESEYLTNSKTGTNVSSTELYKRIIIESVGPTIEDVEGEPVNYLSRFEFPHALIKKAESPKSGDDAKTIEIEYDILNNGVESIMTVDIISELEALHI